MMYCPASQGDIFHEFNTEQNKWNPDASGELTNYTRAGYGIRPMAWDQRPILWRSGAFLNPPLVDASTPAKAWAPYPKLSKFKQRALVTDLFPTPHRVLWRHKKIVNVLYADGSANPFDVEAFYKKIKPTVTYKTPPGADAWAGPALQQNEPVSDWATLLQPFGAALGGANGAMAVGWELLDRAGGAPANGVVFPNLE